MIKIHESKHLSKDEQIKMGSYYTPKELVDEIYKQITPYLENEKDAIIFDSSAGCGAFIINNKKYDYRASDYDNDAYNFLSEHLDKNKIFLSNSLFEVDRKKYNIPPKSYLVMIGNPPYNDTTSEFKSGQKGKNICDEDLFDRDLGVSFLKSYNKLNADLICILHPLSYLIKKTNFNRLKIFKENYKLINGTIFPSSLFNGTGNIKFPILIAFYKKDEKGMDYDYIYNFKFNILNKNKTFKISDFSTTDGHINKYPPKTSDLIQNSPIGLYYYTFRDLNSLRKNTAFMDTQKSNSIVVTKGNFYKYAYLHSLKKLFQPEDIWIYGNLSPLVDIDFVEKNKKLFVQYAILTNPVLLKTNRKILQDILQHYEIKNNSAQTTELEVKINNFLNKLVR